MLNAFLITSPFAIAALFGFARRIDSRTGKFKR
jgi:hypothetical protein